MSAYEIISVMLTFLTCMMDFAILVIVILKFWDKK